MGSEMCIRDRLDPDRAPRQDYDLVHRSDNKMCPKTVQRCEQCRIAFGRNDVVLVKTVGSRERTDKNGKTVKYQGNVYLHYLTSCLREYDQNFSFKNVVVSARTLALLPDNSRQIFLDKGLKVE